MNIDRTARREMVEKLLQMEQTVNAPTISAKVVDGYLAPCCNSGCANDGCCSSTCAFTWWPIKG